MASSIYTQSMTAAKEVNFKELSYIESRAVGCLLTAMIGDILGAPIEGVPRSEIRKDNRGIVDDFLPGQHMGVPDVIRHGMYTDDTNTMMALATSLCKKLALDPWDCARCNAEFYCMNESLRGCPKTAQAVIREILDGTHYTKTGTLIFEDGSYGNGGAMRIGPIGIAFRNANDKQLHSAVTEAIRSTHIHLEAIDGAFLIAKSVSYLLKIFNPEQFNAEEFVSMLYTCSQNELIKGKLQIMKDYSYVYSVAPNRDIATRKFTHFNSDAAWKIDDEVLAKICSDVFQIRTSDAVAAVIWGFLRYWRDPEACLMALVGFGGDTDTLATIGGYLVGSLHGCRWIPKRWYRQMENSKWGRDYVLKCAIELSKLDLKQISEPKEDLFWKVTPIHKPKSKNDV